MPKFDWDGDGLIKTNEFPDQTCDTWTVHGICASCGGLWIAALQAANAIEDRINLTTKTPQKNIGFNFKRLKRYTRRSNYLQ